MKLLFLCDQQLAILHNCALPTIWDSESFRVRSTRITPTSGTHARRSVVVVVAVVVWFRVWRITKGGWAFTNKRRCIGNVLKLVLQMVICTCQSLSLSSCHIRGQVWCQGQFCVWCSERDSEFICVGPGSIQSHLWYHIALLKPHHVEMGRKSNMQIESLHHWPLKTSSSTKDHKRMMDLRVLVEPRVAETSPWGWKHHGILSALWLSLQGTSGLRCLSTERTFMRVRYGGCSSNLSLNIHNSGIDVTVEQRTEQTESTQPWFSIRFSSMFPLHITSAKVLATFLHKN